MTETTLMLLTAFHTKKETPSKSLAAIYSDTFISEGQKRKFAASVDSVRGMINVLKDKKFFD